MTHFWLWIRCLAVLSLGNGGFVGGLSLRSEMTSGVFCRDPKGIANGRRLPEVGEIGLMAQGSQLHFSCTPGFVLDGSSKMVCGSEGSWEPPNKPTCKPVVCPDLQIENGQIQPRKPNGKYYPGLMVQVTCNDGYRLKDKYMDLIECHMSGSWMRHIHATDDFLMGSDLPLCVEQTCASPPQLANSDIQIQGDIGWDGGYVLGSMVSYLCHYGYQIEDLRGSSLVCRKNGQWEPEHDDTPLSKCVHGGCSRPLPIINGNFAPHLSTVYPHDATVTYYCYMGFAVPHTSTFQCTADGKWSPPMQPEYLPVCRHHSASGCSDPPYINNGHIVKINSSGPLYGSDLYPENTVVHYACQSGFRFHDCTASKIVCKGGRWINQLPQCVELNGCGRPLAVPYAIISRSYHDTPSESSEDILLSVPLYSKIHYKCLPGFTLLGTPDLTCGLDGCWAPNLPQCVLLGTPYEPPEWKLASTPTLVQQNDISWTDTHLMTVSMATAGSIIGALLLIQLLVVFQRRKCCFFLFHRQRRHRQHPHYRPRRSSSTSASLASSSPRRLTNHDPDRVALIAFADGVQVVLPTYEEAIRQSGPPALEAVNGIRGPSNRGFLPMLPRRSRTTNMRNNNNTDSSVIGPTRHSSTSTSHSASGVDSMGSTDTVATSEVSTAVTLDTLSSTASNASQQLSCRAMCGSLTSFDTSSVINSEGVPLLEEAEIETSETNENIASDDDATPSPTSS